MNDSGKCVSRREFLQKIILGGCLLSVKPVRLFSRMATASSEAPMPAFQFDYRTTAVRHLAELQAEFEALKSAGQISDNPKFRAIIDKFSFNLPENFRDAKTVIVLATFTPLSLVNIQYAGNVYQFFMPPQYSDDGISLDDLTATLRRTVLQEKDYRLERARYLFLKRLAVRSGLAQYGRNNITFVEGMGSFITLYAFLTDYQSPTDNWQELKMMKSCQKCMICRRACPNQCIRDEKFVIDAGRCTTLYNESAGEIPQWIAPTAHNALMGCMRCQYGCPANQSVIKKTTQLEDISEAEVQQILSGAIDEPTREILQRKLRDFYPVTKREYLPIITRNLKLLLPSA